MSPILLSGVGGSSNWLPLIYPLVGIVIILYTVDFIIKFIRKRKLHRDNQLMNDISSIDNITGQNMDNPNS